MDVLLITGLLFLWNLVVIHYISRWFYEYFKRFERVPAEYISRKTVHILSGGITALLIPIFFQRYYWVVTLSAILLTYYLYFRRKRGLLYWFQVKENSYEVHFALVYGVILMVGVGLGDEWIGLLPILFMSFGDSATGIVRAFTQRRQVKSWDGTLTMIVVCSIIGYWKLGWYGVLVGIMTSLTEKIPNIDDNITVPVVATILVFLARFFR